MPNLEMHIYGRGGHPISPKDTSIPAGSWRERFVEWFRDLGYLGAPGIETKAAADVAQFAKKQK